MYHPLLLLLRLSVVSWASRLRHRPPVPVALAQDPLAPHL